MNLKNVYLKISPNKVIFAFFYCFYSLYRGLLSSLFIWFWNSIRSTSSFNLFLLPSSSTLFVQPSSSTNWFENATAVAAVAERRR